MFWEGGTWDIGMGQWFWGWLYGWLYLAPSMRSQKCSHYVITPNALTNTPGVIPAPREP